MTTVNVGDNSVSAQPLVRVTVPAGATVNLSNLSGSTLNYFAAGIDGGATALTVGNNVNLTTTAWVQSTGVSSIQLTGGFY